MGNIKGFRICSHGAVRTKDGWAKPADQFIKELIDLMNRHDIQELVVETVDCHNEHAPAGQAECPV